MIRDRATRSSRGFAFITFALPASTTAAITHMHGLVVGGPFEGRALRVGRSARAGAAAAKGEGGGGGGGGADCGADCGGSDGSPADGEEGAGGAEAADGADA